MKTFRPLFLFTALILVVGLACGLGGGGSDTPAQPQQEQPQSNPPSQPEQPQAPPSNEQSSGSAFFTQEFDQDPGWWFFLTEGGEKTDFMTVEFTDSLMIFDFQETGIFAYYMFEDFSYENVRIDIRAENRGKNNNNVSLVCRMSDEGWYEFSTEGGGLWYLYAVIFNEDDKAVYNRIDNGGAASLKQGKEVNEYGMLCEDDEITMFVNGKELKTRVEDDYSFRDGLVGFNISSLNVTPIILEVDWFKVSEP